MMNNGKYIVINDNRLIMFDGTFNHNDFRIFENSIDKITSAGFFTAYPSKDNYGISVCTNYGESHTLKIGPKDFDKDLIKARILGITLFEL